MMKHENPVSYITHNYTPVQVASALRNVLPRTYKLSPMQGKMLRGPNGAAQFLGTLPKVYLEKIIVFLDSQPKPPLNEIPK